MSEAEDLLRVSVERMEITFLKARESIDPKSADPVVLVFGLRTGISQQLGKALSPGTDFQKLFDECNENETEPSVVTAMPLDDAANVVEKFNGGAANDLRSMRSLEGQFIAIGIHGDTIAFMGFEKPAS